MNLCDQNTTPILRHTATLSIAEDVGDYRVSEEADASPSSALHKQGQALRIAMALVTGATEAGEDRLDKADELRTRMALASGASSAPEADADLAARLQRLARTGDRAIAEQLRLLPRFDDAQLWKEDGCRDCIVWMDRHLGLHSNRAYERLRMARELQSLPLIESLFALGQLSYSHVRELTRVADADCERELVAAVLELSVSETAEFCRRWRFSRQNANSGSRAHDDGRDAGADGFDGENDARAPTADELEADDAMRAFQDRSLTFRTLGRGRGRITIDLPLDLFAEVAKVLECMEDQLREQEREPEESIDPDSPVGSRSARQFRADSLVHMSRKAIAHEGEAIAKADRYRVLLTAGVDVLPTTPSSNECAAKTESGYSERCIAGVENDHVPDSLPAKEAHTGDRPHNLTGDQPGTELPQLIGFGPIAHATARRLAETATMTVLATLVDGEVVGVSHDTRLWPRPMVRAVIARDRCCQMPGCTRTRFGQVHHVIPVAAGGRTEIRNACQLCSTCHRALHEGRFSLERVCADDVDLGKNADTLPMSDAERTRSRERVARVQRFRLLREDGTVVAGPRRRVDPFSMKKKTDDDERIERLMSLIATDGQAPGSAVAA